MHQRLQVIIARHTHESRALIDDAKATSQEMQNQAAATLRAAQADVERTLAEVDRTARERIASAERESSALVSRAEQRVIEAEQTAGRIRERLNGDLTKLRADTFAQTRATREEAVSMLNKARADADRVRAEAEAMLERAREEVSRLVSDQPEGTFARLRYSLGGDRPSQTTHQTLSPSRITALD